MYGTLVGDGSLWPTIGPTNCFFLHGVHAFSIGKLLIGLKICNWLIEIKSSIIIDVRNFINMFPWEKKSLCGES
jgi:hypothetical protein